MSPPESTPNATEQASWLSSPEPKKMQSLKRYISTRIDILFDGAYFWFNGEPILVPEFDSELNAWKIITNKPSRGKIITINPGAKKVSKLLPMSREGNSLALLQSRWGYEKLNHIEAENEKLIREVDYAEIFRYLGEDHLVRIMAWYGAFFNFLEKTHSMNERFTEFSLPSDQKMTRKRTPPRQWKTSTFMENSVFRWTRKFQTKRACNKSLINQQPSTPRSGVTSLGSF